MAANKADLTTNFNGMETKHFYCCNYLSSASCGMTDLNMQYQNIVMQCFVSVNDAEDGETVEIQAEDDGTLLVENMRLNFQMRMD